MARQVIVWEVDRDLSEAARRFIGTFNELFKERLPPPDPEQAGKYWEASDETQIVGRCVRLGYSDIRTPFQHYHWAICRQSDGALAVQEFWHENVWTTAAYRAVLGFGGGCPDVPMRTGLNYGDIIV